MLDAAQVGARIASLEQVKGIFALPWKGSLR